MLIGICGKARSGKDLLGEHLIALSKHTMVKYSFASPIKTACNNLFGWDARHSDGDLKEVDDEFWGFSPRKAYQTLGTEWGRQCLRDDLWIRVAQKETEGKDVVIPDVRFENEGAFIIDQGGWLIRVTRPEISNNIVGIEGHASETGLPQSVIERAALQRRFIDITNDGSYEKYSQTAEDLYDFICKHN